MDYNNLIDPYEIARFIRDTKKTTPVKAYVNGDLKNTNFDNIKFYGNNGFYILFGEHSVIKEFLLQNSNNISHYDLEFDRRNSAVKTLDYLDINARIEPGSIIRDKVSIGEHSIIMMGAVINIGSEIGAETMIDMNAVIGARAIIGKRSHIGAGSVIAGVIEPPSNTPCIIGDNVIIGANSVILEGIIIGNNSVIGAGSVVTSDVPENVVFAGTPAKFIKFVDQKTKLKTEILEDLRK